MNGQASQPNPANEAFGKGVGFVVAIFTTMPLYHISYDWFYRYALTYSHFDYYWFWELVYIASLFFAIVVSCWFALNMALSLLKSCIGLLIVLLMSFRR